MKEPARRRKWIFLAVKLSIVALLIWGVHKTLDGAIEDLGKHEWSLQPMWLVAAGGLYLLGTAPSCLYWFSLLRAMGQRPTFLETARAYYIGHLGKYVPGKALVVVLRAGFVKSSRTDGAVAAVSVFPETLTMMAVGAFLSSSILILLFPGQRFLILVAAGLMIASGLPTIPAVFQRLLKLVPGGKYATPAAERLKELSFGLMVRGWLGIMVGWTVMGLSLWATLRSLGVAELHPLYDLPLLTASVALAMVAGFLSLIPGGIVVRELVLTQLLAPQLGDEGEATALVAAIFLRLAWLLAELVISGILYVLRGPREVRMMNDER